MKTHRPFGVIVHFPETEAGKAELQRRVSEVHADYVLSVLQKLDCPADQKIELIEAIIHDIEERLLENA